MMYGGRPFRGDSDESLPAAPEPAESAEPADTPIHDPVLRHRFLRFLSFGMTVRQAETLAIDKSVDTHDVEQMIDRGCPPDIAFDIAA
jgi:hypothetical protein